MADYTQAERMMLAKKGHALPDGSFPVTDANSLHSAIKLVGNANDPAKAKAFIMRRARALQLKSAIPLSWM